MNGNVVEVLAQASHFSLFGNIIKIIAVMNNGNEIRINRMALTDVPKAGDEIFAFWDPKFAEVIPTKSEIELNTAEKIKEGEGYEDE